MADNQVLSECAGLQVSNNTFSASPPGSLLRADNLMIVQKGVGQPRNGQNRAYLMPTPQKIPWAMTEFQGSLLVNYAIDKFDDEYGLGIAGSPTIGFTSFDGFFNPVDFDGANESYGRMKFGFADRYLYFCSTTGPKALETLAGQPRSAGLLRMPDVYPSMTSPLGTPGFLPYGSSVAYRSVLRLPTDSGVSLLSPPSGRGIITNRLLAGIGAMVRTGGNLVTVTFPGTLNPGIDIGDTFVLTPGEANFAAGTYTVTGATNNVITYTSVGANVSNTVAQDLNIGPRDTALLITLSADATVTTPIRVYRSLATSSGNTDPSDEMFLVDEFFPTPTQIANHFILYDDTTPESVLADPLYTNPQTGEGAAQANFAPPLYRDLAYFQNRMWFANTTARHAMNVQMLGVGSPNGVQNNDTFTINVPSSTTYAFTFKTASGASDEPQIVSNGTPSFNIQQTAQNLVLSVNAIMAFNDEPVRAYYVSDQDGSPGRVYLERIDFAPSAFTEGFGITVSRPESWTPALDSVTDTFSTAEHIPNGLSYTKLSQAEAVPSTNYTRVGSSNYAIARVLALQQALLVCKQGDGIYAVTGQFPFQVQQISTANIIAIDAAAVFADSAWVYTDQGILRVSDSGGAVVVSRPIETELNYFRDLMPEGTRDYAFVVPYEVERRIMFFVPTDFRVGVSDGDRYVLTAYCYCNATDSWTHYTYAAFSGVVSPSLSKLYLGTYDYPWATSRVTLERKGNGHLDTADANWDSTVTSSTLDTAGNRVLRLSSGSDVEAGDGITQGSFRTKIKALRPDLGSRWVELYENLPFGTAPGACVLYKHFDVTVQFQPTGHPTARKTLTRISFSFKPEHFECLGGKTLMLTDQIQANVEIDTPSRGFGLNPFGQGPFGDPTPLVVDVNPLDAKWTNAAQFFPGFKLSEVWVRFRLQGYTASVATQDAPAGRGR